jgi:hypothetical protein
MGADERGHEQREKKREKEREIDFALLVGCEAATPKTHKSMGAGAFDFLSLL